MVDFLTVTLARILNCAKKTDQAEDKERRKEREEGREEGKEKNEATGTTLSSFPY